MCGVFSILKNMEIEKARETLRVPRAIMTLLIAFYSRRRAPDPAQSSAPAPPFEKIARIEACWAACWVASAMPAWTLFMVFGLVWFFAWPRI